MFLKNKLSLSLFVTILLIGGYIAIKIQVSQKDKKDMKLRVAFPYDKPASHYEPTRIHLGPEYIFLENIYSPLVELSNANGQPIGGVAEKFQWDEKTSEYYLHIRKGLKTIDGYEITAFDAEFSLKRLLVNSSNTHGNFKDIICPDSELETIESPCDGIEVKDKYTLILRPGEKKPFLTHILTAIDFAVIPKTSVDPKTLAIIDYRNTSGPYYVDSSSEDGKILLRVNPNHYHYSDALPQEVEFIPSGIGTHKSSIDLYKEGKVDHITTIDKLNPEKIINLSKEVNDASLHTTMDIRTFAVFFTERGLKEFSSDERLAYGMAIKDALSSYFLSQPGYQDRKQFLPPFGDGQLSEDQKETVEQKIKNMKTDIRGEKLKLALLRVGSIENYQKPLEKALPGIEIYESNKIPALTNYSSLEEMPHAFIGGPDITFNEDISLITYSINAGVFGMSKVERQQWIAKYMSIIEKSARLDMLQKLHFKSLMDGIIYPLASSPYIALLRKPWKSHLPQIFANNPIWTITKN
ncbi:MAG: hypothetical protein COW00_02385 [Bdellovibrio sp. CG12_big_fil_rev_8_21_14_0_65_39_13]|nr:MAG: hypothetical protein COW78_09590 [Bdellovibrio sp. CG22_combo_CG10-13_8_21_14_all_39_27]PIQ62095.1 MAG: hypothetical protein COW00_02385 [Bdellovibrio sp. CG12_big_fil_rev_8_21_14_0_65_39_13]PIR32403.1 MAG: hypothetical protein COV37_20070 [Bdellovibrio sp. CG11_big_fil_rev_8_21_14_0_20_39_38]